LKPETVVKIQQHKLWLEKEGYRPKTVRSSISNLKSLARHSNIDNPESVKTELARRDVTEGTKEKYCWVYERYLRQHGIRWDRPRYRRIERLPFVPSELDIDQLVGGFSKRLATIVLFVKETGCRKGEMWNVKWNDLNPEKNYITINCPEKNSKPRRIRISSRLISLINQLPRRCDYVFKRSNESNRHVILSYFWQKRKEIAEKVNNPNLMRLDFKSLRHFKASREYYKTKDILYVKELLGHKSLKNTLVYVHHTDFEEDNSFIVKVASTLKEFTSLIERGYEFVSDYQDVKILRKRRP
jgi:integrase